MTLESTAGQTAAAEPAVSPAQTVIAPPRKPAAEPAFLPKEPETLEEAGLTFGQVESLVLKFLLNHGSATGRNIADHVRLPFGLLNRVLFQLKSQLILTYIGSAPMNDYEYDLTEAGVQRARRFSERCTYFGSAPVTLEDYIAGVHAQSVRREKPRVEELLAAFKDLTLPTAIISQIGQAISAGMSFFLYGSPGNGKTSIAERVIGTLSREIWIPRTLTVTGEMIRLYDPSNHRPAEKGNSVLDAARYDRRWVKIRRPTIVAGGELTLKQLEITTNHNTGISEAPLQLKSNCGVLVIDDFGRQRCSTDELLNRWIVPLEKRVDYLSLPSGRQIEVPFDQLLVFSTNLEPRKLVDEAFLRRIPYKIEVLDPSEKQFTELFLKLAAAHGFQCPVGVVEGLLARHYRDAVRTLRFCHARDLLLQAKHFCLFHEQPMVLTPAILDVAVNNYFAGI